MSEAIDGQPLPSCPFCGRAEPASNAFQDRWMVSCTGCPGNVITDSQETAEAAWRRRPTVKIVGVVR